MSLHAAILTVAGDFEAAAQATEPPLATVKEWSPIQWSRVDAANDDLLIEATPERKPKFHSTDSGLPWLLAKVG